MGAKKSKTNSASEPLLTEGELAKRKNLKERFLKDARIKYGLKHYKLGRLVRYKESDFDEWAEQRKVG